MAITSLQKLGIDHIHTEDVLCLNGAFQKHVDVLFDLINQGTKVKVPVIITPELAEEFLKRNTSNIRVLNKRRVKENLAPDIAAGNWVPLNAVVAFDELGCLKNGQHTCAAVVEGGRPIIAWVQTGITQEQEMVMDNCSPRSAYHSITGMDLKSQGVLKAMLEHGTQSQSDTSNHALAKYWNRFSSCITQVMEIREAYVGKPDNAVFHAALATALYNGVSTDDIKGLVKEMFGDATEWVQASQFKNTLSQNHYRGYTAKTKRRQFSLALMVLENYLSGEGTELPRVDAVDRYQPLEHWSIKL